MISESRPDFAPCRRCGALTSTFGVAVIYAKCDACKPVLSPLQRQQRRASALVEKAIRDGELAPVQLHLCVDCGKPAEAYDHREYAKPLKVAPVCRGCNNRRGPAIDSPPYKVRKPKALREAA